MKKQQTSGYKSGSVQFKTIPRTVKKLKMKKAVATEVTCPSTYYSIERTGVGHLCHTSHKAHKPSQKE